MYQSGQENLDELLEVLDNAHRYDHYILARCPFHDDQRPSFFVYPDKYWCASCRAYGDTSKLLEKIKPSYVPTIQERFYNPWTKWLKEHNLAFILDVAYQHRPSQYLIDRGIDASTQRSLGIGKLDDWITFPIRDQDWRIVGAVARAGETNQSKAKYVVPAKQDPSLLYVPSWKRISKSNKVFVTFGILDAVTLYMLGYPALSTTGGKQIQPSAFDQIRKKLIIIPDLGEEREAHQLASKLGWRGNVARLPYPDTTKDINDILQRYHNPEQIKRMIEVYHELV